MQQIALSVAALIFPQSSLSAVIAWISDKQHCFRLHINDCISLSGLKTGFKMTREREKKQAEKVELESVGEKLKLG